MGDGTSPPSWLVQPPGPGILWQEEAHFTGPQSGDMICVWPADWAVNGLWGEIWGEKRDAPASQPGETGAAVEGSGVEPEQEGWGIVQTREGERAGDSCTCGRYNNRLHPEQSLNGSLPQQSYPKTC